jgi:hypothetical protein
MFLVKHLQGHRATRGQPDSRSITPDGGSKINNDYKSPFLVLKAGYSASGRAELTDASAGPVTDMVPDDPSSRPTS